MVNSMQIFHHFPKLRENLAHICLAELPTPVEKLQQLGKAIGVESLYVKRDDLTGKLYGGNKVRKLEFFLGKALQDGVKEVLTFGYAGSNHALATAIYAKEVGLRSISMLIPQPNAYYVRRNLLMSYVAGAELHHYRSMSTIKLGAIYQLLKHKVLNGRFPNIIPPGGSAPLGVIGFVNAALELKQQINDGVLPEPDLLYVALGSKGTAIGLILGLKVAQLKTRVIPVRVGPKVLTKEEDIFRLFRNTNEMLSSHDPTFPAIDISVDDFNIRHDFFGRQYALFTEEGAKAIRTLQEMENITLEGTYTGKALAALLADADQGKLADKTVLFWNTYNSRDLNERIAHVDYHALPTSLHRYFEEDVQALDGKN